MKEAIKNFMVEKAKEIFEKKGFTDTTIEDIAKASTISVPTFYKYFQGKQDVIIEVIKSIDAQLDKEFEPILISDIEFFSKLENLLRKMIEFVKNNKEIVRIAFFDSQAFFSNQKCEGNYMLKHREKRLATTMQLFDLGKAEGILNKDINSEYISLFLDCIYEYG